MASGNITRTPDYTLTSTEDITNDKINRVGGGTFRVDENSITTRELSTALAGGYDTVVALRANTEAQSNGVRVPIKGYYDKDDGDFGPDLIVDTTDSTTVDDGFSCFVDANNVRYKRVLDEIVFPTWAGCKGDGSTDDLSKIQVIEDYLNTLGGGTIHWNDDKTFIVSDFIEKKANVYWVGKGKIKRDATSNTYPLVKCHEISNWSIGSLRFENAVWNTVTHTAGSIDDFNCCVSVTGCDDWIVNGCEFRKYHAGIRVLKSDDWSILNCDFDGETGETVAGMWAGSWTEPTSVTATGDINTYPAYSVSGYSYDDDIANTGFIIEGNHCKSVGLDVGIQLSEQVYETTPGVVASNYIQGTRHGIAVYRGSNADPGTSTTYSRHINIVGNHISYCFENAIYVRTDQGVLVEGNMLYRNNKKGTFNSQTGGGIVFRVGVDDFNAVVSSTPTFDTGNMCVGNFIIDTGDPTNGTAANVNDGAIVVRTRYTYVWNNSIVNTEESGYDREGTGISALPGTLDRGCEIRGNRIYNFLYGLYTGAQTHQDEGTSPWIVKDNVIERVQDGILFEPLMPDCVINGNTVRDHTGEGIKVRFAPRAKILNNIIEDGVDGIHIAGGCFDTRINNRSTARRGAGIHVIGNICSRLTGTDHKVSETGATDLTFYNRCAVIANEVVDGQEQHFINGRSGGNPVYSFAEGRVWNNGDKFYDSDGVSAGGVEGKICTTAGVYGTITPTGDTTNTSDQLTSISSMDHLFVGAIINVAGVTGPLTITAMNTGASSATISPVADATTSSANITYQTPVFKDVGTIAV